MGFGDVYAAATIVLEGTSNVPAVYGVRFPSATLGGGFEDQDLGAWGCQWGASGVRSKSKAPFSWAFVERHGLIWYGRRRLRVKVACERRQVPEV